MHSTDNGQTWSTPQILIDSILDDRDAAVCQTPKGTLLVTWFTSIAWLKSVFEVEGRTDNWPKAKIQAWQDMKRPIELGQYRYPVIKEEMSRKPRVAIQWMIRSEDDGRTWSGPYIVPMLSPHGPIVANDGRLLFAGKDGSTIGLCQSTDDGKTWDMVSSIEPMSGHAGDDYHELHMVEAADGTLIVQIRNHNDTFRFETLQTESHDAGKTWTPVRSIGVWGFPSHLLRLKNDTILMTYSHRGIGRKPVQSNRVEARISEDKGKTWSEPIILSDHLWSSDFGYPSSVQLGNGKILTVWYELQSDSPNAVLRQAVWEIRE
jgi:Neuraminidase (sialidase)